MPTKPPSIVERFAERLQDRGTTSQALAPPHPPAPASGPIGVVPRPDAPAPSPAPSKRIIPIDAEEMSRKGFVMPGAGKTLLSEEFRILKAPLLRKALGPEAVPKGNAIMVTSARPGEGKTFTAVNLALSIASERDLHVVLIDADIYTQSVLKTLDMTADRGLVDLLLHDDLNVPDVLLKTSVPNLSVLPAGASHPQATELLSSQRMNRLMQDILPRYPDRIIVIDTPPLLSCTESSVMASHVGQIVMVVEQNVTGWRLVDRALAMLHNCSEINFVLNKVESFGRNDRFGGKSNYAQQYYLG